MFGRSRVALIGFAAAAALLTAACSGGAPQAATVPPSPTSTGQVQLTFAVYGPAPVVTAYTRIAADFSAEHPGTVVNIQPYPDHATEAAAIDRKLAAGDPTDGFLTDLSDLPTLIQNKWVQPLDKLLVARHVDFGDGIQRGALEAFSAQNALQCMPVSSSPLVVYYNTDLLALGALSALGAPPITPDTGWSMSDFAQAARAASGGDVRGVYVAPDLDQVAPFVWSGGGRVVDDQNSPRTLTLSSSASTAAVEQLLQIVHDPQLTFTAAEIDRRSALQRFETGTLAMILGYRDLTPQLRAVKGLHFDVMPMPKIRTEASTGQTSGLCLSRASQHPEQAADFLAYAVSADAMSALAETGYVVPANLDVLNSAAFAQPTLQPASAQVFTASMRAVVRFPNTDAWPSVQTAADAVLRELFLDPASPAGPVDPTRPVDPVAQRLAALDAASVPLFAPRTSASPTATPTP